MADEKKYSAQEAAIAVLAKAQELLGKSTLVKSEKVAQETSGLHTVSYFKAPDLKKSENPDEKQDAKLGEEVEGLCERHMLDNKSAERKEGHKIVKSELCKMCKGGKDLQKAELAELYGMIENMQKAEKVNEIGTKFMDHEVHKLGKAENKAAPANPMKPKVGEEQAPQRDAAGFEPKPGHAAENDQRQAPQAAPQANPQEQIEGNNPAAGSAPFGGKGVHKLSHFMGHRAAKNGMKKGIALG